MGAYDTVRVGNREGQVKCWESYQMKTFGPGDKVGTYFKPYSVAMREGGYVNVFESRIEDWTDEPSYYPVIDKWGYLWDDNAVGILGEDYFHG